MLWLDSVFAVPTVAVRLETNYGAVSDIQKRIMPFIDKLHKSGRIQRIEQKEIWGYSLIAGGFTFHLRNDNIAVSYAYSVDEISRPGTLPSFEMPELRTYSEIMKETCEYVREILLSLDAVDDLRYDRIGVVADANLEGDSLPPE
ncbi:MAG: hypothetical protein DRI57_29145 [Deltaproteobacteria bacterium]|nr:MAG: hypothetical protein DRI57_29145 [Deltaproteobacteria bacterium]